MCEHHASLQITDTWCARRRQETAAVQQARSASNVHLELFQISLRLCRWKSVFSNVLILLTCPGFPENYVRQASAEQEQDCFPLGRCSVREPGSCDNWALSPGSSVPSPLSGLGSSEDCRILALDDLNCMVRCNILQYYTVEGFLWDFFSVIFPTA